jgi:hypothetical protein
MPSGGFYCKKCDKLYDKAYVMWVDQDFKITRPFTNTCITCGSIVNAQREVTPYKREQVFEALDKLAACDGPCSVNDPEDRKRILNDMFKDNPEYMDKWFENSSIIGKLGSIFFHYDNVRYLYESPKIGKQLPEWYASKYIVNQS